MDGRAKAVPPSSAEFTLLAKERAEIEDATDAAHMIVREIGKAKVNEVVTMAGTSLREAQHHPGRALVYIHGFNTDFDNALARAAQLAYDLEFEGPVFLFSWPSKGGDTWWQYIKGIFNYRIDRTNAENARVHFAKFLEQIVLPLKPPKLEIIAHSMGNKLLLEVLENEFIRRGQSGSIADSIDEIIFAAPDVAQS